MSPKPTQQQLAKDLYLHTEKTQQQIADILDVNRRTIYLWIKNGRWEEMKLAARQGPAILIQDIYNHIGEINAKVREREPGDRCPTMEEVEKLRKLVNMTKDINKKHTGLYLEAFEELIFYIARNDVKLSQTVVKHANNYVKGNFGDEKFYMDKARGENISRVIKNLKDDKEVIEEDTVTVNPAEGPTNVIPQTNFAIPTNIVIPSDIEGSHNTPSTPSDNEGRNISLSLGEGRGEVNGISCDNNASTPPPTEKLTEPATELTITSNSTEKQPPSYPTGNFSKNEITPHSTEDLQLPPATFPSPQDSLTELDKMMQLPPAERTSPFRDGYIIWVNHIDDVEKKLDNFGKPWGELKMADSIRHYPDMDPATKRDKAFYEMCLKIKGEQKPANNSRPTYYDGSPVL